MQPGSTPVNRKYAPKGRLAPALFQNWGHRRKPPTQKPLAVPASMLDDFPARAGDGRLRRGNEQSGLVPVSGPCKALDTQSSPGDGSCFAGASLCGLVDAPRPRLTSQPPCCPGRRQKQSSQPPLQPPQCCPGLLAPHPPCPEPTGRWASGSGRGAGQALLSPRRVRAGTCC